MKGYGQFCPMALATEIIGERWTLLILRELMLGSSRFNDIHPVSYTHLTLPTKA